MLRCTLAALTLAVSLSGCGLAGMGGAAATEGAASAQQASAAQQQLDKVRTDLDAAQKAAADTRAKAEAESQ